MSLKININDKGLLCRFCLIKPKVYYNIDDDIINIIEALTSIKLFIEDQNTTVLCTKCLLNIRLVQRIVNNIKNSDKKLQEMRRFSDNIEIVTVKSEVFEDDKDEIFISDTVIHNTNLNDRMEERVSDSELNKTLNEIKNEELQEDVIDNKKPTDSHNIREKNNIQSKSKYQKPRKDCPICKKSFQRSYYDHHIKTHKLDTADQIFDCSHCDKKFTKLSLSRHTASLKYLKQHSECPVCKKTFSKSNLAQHMKIHTDVRVICELCGVSIKPNSLFMHKTLRHSGNVRFKCEQCDKTYTKKVNLNNHIRRDHQGEKTHVCDICGKAFFTAYRLSMHTQRTHEKIRPYSCQYCEKKFSSRHALRTHERQHTNETPYKCEVCGEGFRQNISLRTHRKSKHNISEELTCTCTICERQFPSEWALKSHTFKKH